MNFEWNIEQIQSYNNNNNTNTTIQHRKKSILDILSNLRIDVYFNLINMSLLPTIDNQIYRLINVHQPLDINTNTNTDTNTNINYIQLYIQRIIYEYLNVDNYIYMEYIINEPKFKQHSKIFKSNINKYLNNITDDKLLLSSIEYIKTNTNIQINLNLKDMQSIINNLSRNNNLLFDMNIISKRNKIILANSYLQFANKDIRSIDILDSIYNLSICKDLIYGRYSSQFKLNKQINDQIILTDIDKYIYKIITESTYVDYEYYILIKHDIIGKINLILDNRMLIIKCDKPSINDYIKYLLMIHRYNIDNQSINQINIIQLYNPINGTIIEWTIINYSYIDLYNYLINI